MGNEKGSDVRTAGAKRRQSSQKGDDRGVVARRFDILGGDMMCEDENVLSAIRAEVDRRIAERDRFGGRLIESESGVWTAHKH